MAPATTPSTTIGSFEECGLDSHAGFDIVQAESWTCRSRLQIDSVSARLRADPANRLVLPLSTVRRMHQRLLIALLALSVCGFTAGCGDATSPEGEGDTDAASDSDSDSGAAADLALDEGGDSQPLEASRLFGPCVEDDQCPGDAAVCLTSAEFGYAGGVCTVPCEDRTPCDDGFGYHFCDPLDGLEGNFCQQRCINGVDCGRDRFTCAAPDGADAGVCTSICLTDADCGSGARCEPFSGQCVADDEPPLESAVTGEPCVDPDDCRSDVCLDEAVRAFPSGYCVADCILPPGYNSSNFYAGDTLPTGDCAGDAICIPALGTSTRGNVGMCFSACESDGDCRTNYWCRRTFTDVQSAGFTNGVCWPENL